MADRDPHVTAGVDSALRARGFTLFELLLVLAILTILTLLSTGLRTLIEDQRLITEVNRLVTALNWARSEAIRRGVRVVMCASSDGASCAHGPRWQGGWITYVDINDNRRLDAGEPVIRVEQAAAPSVRLAWNAALGRDHQMTYLPSGLGTPNGTFVICDRRGAAAARGVVINRAGRPRAVATSTGRWRARCPTA